MNQIPYLASAPLPPMQLRPLQLSWFPFFPPDPPPSSDFWTTATVKDRFKELQHIIALAQSMRKELEMLIKVKESNGSPSDADDRGNEVLVSGFWKFLQGRGIDVEAQGAVTSEAASAVMSKLRALLEPFRVVVDETSPWEEKSAAVRLGDKVKKSNRNKGWRKRKRKRVAEALEKERNQFEELDQKADEWRVREIAKDMAQRKVEKMKEIAKKKAKEEKKRLESELELVLIVEKLQELRSIRIEKMKKQGHFLPDEDDKFLEKVRAAVEEEERQARAAADTDAAKEAIASAEESRKVNEEGGVAPKDDNKKNENKAMEKKVIHHGSDAASDAETGNKKVAQRVDGQRHGAYDYVANLPQEFYHYYHGSNTDMGTLIEVRRSWDSYIRPGGSRIPGHWVQPPPPADEIWASYLVPPIPKAIRGSLEESEQRQQLMPRKGDRDREELVMLMFGWFHDQ
ncbi:U11/U12 small nuclear ribonucleoprotein 59 kDa protein-like protein [Drosera capensis]